MKREMTMVLIVVLVIVAVSGFLGWQKVSANAAAASVRLQTATVERGTIAATVSAAGNVAAPEDAVMAFQTSGRVAKVNVQIGDRVKKGQLLMELDTTDLDLALKTAKVNLASSQASLDQTKANLQFALRNAQGALASSQANLDAAKAKNAQNANQIIIAKTQLEKAAVALQQAQGAYNQIAWRGDVALTKQASDLQQATLDYQSALANYNLTIATINDTALKSAQTQFDKDQVALEQAQRNLDTQLRTAQAAVDKDQVAVEQALRNVDKARIYAPYDGAIAALNFSVGDSAGTGNAITVVDVSTLQIKVTVAEVDIPKIKADQTAQVTLDAIPGKTYTAKVLAVGPVGTITQGVVNFPLTVIVNNNDGAIKPGMTANLAISIEKREDVLMLPTRAVRTQGTQRVVTVLYKGQQIAMPVTTGMTGDQNIEIVAGLREGDQVLLQQTQTRQTGGLGVPGAGPILIPR
ncbi:MAG: efflux RND transporter periplasmic adaptor subunit [Chloroflexi bacterium]|nr:efflux RND transporter periplasmic adaptor subunit [Chloroflexota bacterium]